MGRTSTPASKAAAIKRKKETDGQVKAKPADVKAAIIEYVRSGQTIAQAVKDLGYRRQSYEYYRRSDPNFRETMDRLLLLKKQGGFGDAREDKSKISFEDFCKEYLDTQLFEHQLQWVDLLEGRTPRSLHENQIYSPGAPEAVLVNTPPEHAKSTTLTINYVTYKICTDPNIRIIIVSKTKDMAKKFLHAVRDRLSGNGAAYEKLQMDFAPEGGFSANSAAWTSDAIYISSELRDSGEKDPTVQALGIRGHIYGSRADLILMDDCVDSSNAHDYAKQIDWIQNEVFSRLAYPAGRLLLIGTRLAPIDLYSEIQKPEYYSDEESPWTYLTQPAVLSYGDGDPKNWVTLWPRTNRPPVSLAARDQVIQDEDGLYPMWPGEALHRKRMKMSPKNWSMVYMQEHVPEDSIFPQKAINGCINSNRNPGPMSRGNRYHRQQGMDGLYVIGGFDPAMTGDSAAVVIGVDRETGKRWLLDCWAQGRLKPDDIRNKIKEWTTKYRVNEWRIEKNAMNLMVTQDREIRDYLHARGCVLKEHFTGANKWDSNFGVASMSTLLEGWEEGKHLLELPSRTNHNGMKLLVEQLASWEPDTKGKTDLVMALWFAEIRARELADEFSAIYHLPNAYSSERSREGQVVIDLDYMAQQNLAQGIQGWMRLS